MGQLDYLYQQGLSTAGPPNQTGVLKTVERANGSIYYQLIEFTVNKETVYYVVKSEPSPNRRSDITTLRLVSIKGICYVAGPMRGLPESNFPAFDAAEVLLQKAGYVTFNPANMDRAHGIQGTTLPREHLVGMREIMDRDCNAVSKSTHIYLIDGWENSTGVQPEAILGKTLHLKYLTGIDLHEVPRLAVAAVIGGRLIAEYQTWLKEQERAAVEGYPGFKGPSAGEVLGG